MAIMLNMEIAARKSKIQNPKLALERSEGSKIQNYHAWYWVLVPVLAVVAYAPVLGAGFLSDDYILLDIAGRRIVDPSMLFPVVNPGTWRPVYLVLVWV